VREGKLSESERKKSKLAWKGEGLNGRIAASGGELAPRSARVNDNWEVILATQKRGGTLAVIRACKEKRTSKEQKRRGKGK